MSALSRSLWQGLRAAPYTILKEGIYECVTIRLAKEGVRR